MFRKDCGELIEPVSGRTVVSMLDIADNFLSRLIGLQGRSSLSAGQGLLLIPCLGGVHTFMMRFAIDLVMLDKNGTVLRVIRHAKPWSIIGGVAGTFAVLEVRAGEGILEEGMSLEFRAKGKVPDSVHFLVRT